MSSITITFDTNLKINESASIGDMVYFTNPDTNYQDSGFSVSNNITPIGEIISLSSSAIIVDYDPNNPQPTSSSFIFFSKDKKINTSSILGYYARADFYNNSKQRAELYSTSCIVEESSK
jgi:hypothetical protein